MTTELNEFSKIRFEHSFLFSSYGAAVRVDSNSKYLHDSALGIAKTSFLGRLRFHEPTETASDYTLGLVLSEAGMFQLFENGQFRSETDSEFVLLNFFTSYLRLIVAERAKPWVFVHAGVVARAGRAVMLPGVSSSGKTTLVAELLKNGADYYSDEYAVLDESGLVHPFPRDLSVRTTDARGSVIKAPAKAFGGRIAAGPAPVALVLITHFAAAAEWKPERLSLGNGIIEVVPHTISIRINTKHSLKVLNQALNHAIILKSARGEADRFVRIVLSLLDADENWS